MEIEIFVCKSCGFIEDTTPGKWGVVIIQDGQKLDCPKCHGHEVFRGKIDISLGRQQK